MELNKNILQEDWGIFREEAPIITGSSLDDITNDILGDYWFFVITILDNEKDNPDYFTKNWDRDTGLPILFRQSYYNYLNSGCMCCYADFLDDWLAAYEAGFKDLRREKPLSKYAKYIECCPYCGHEIDITLPKGSKYIKFCPECGAPKVYLCSTCMEIYGDCNTAKGFCKKEEK